MIVTTEYAAHTQLTQVTTPLHIHRTIRMHMYKQGLPNWSSLSYVTPLIPARDLCRVLTGYASFCSPHLHSTRYSTMLPIHANAFSGGCIQLHKTSAGLTE